MNELEKILQSDYKTLALASEKLGRLKEVVAVIEEEMEESKKSLNSALLASLADAASQLDLRSSAYRNSEKQALFEPKMVAADDALIKDYKAMSETTKALVQESYNQAQQRRNLRTQNSSELAALVVFKDDSVYLSVHPEHLESESHLAHTLAAHLYQTLLLSPKLTPPPQRTSGTILELYQLQAEGQQLSAANRQEIASGLTAHFPTELTEARVKLQVIDCHQFNGMGSALECTTQVEGELVAETKTIPARSSTLVHAQTQEPVPLKGYIHLPDAEKISGIFEGTLYKHIDMGRSDKKLVHPPLKTTTAERETKHGTRTSRYAELNSLFEITKMYGPSPVLFTLDQAAEHWKTYEVMVLGKAKNADTETYKAKILEIASNSQKIPARMQLVPFEYQGASCLTECNLTNYLVNYYAQEKLRSTKQDTISKTDATLLLHVSESDLEHMLEKDEINAVRAEISLGSLRRYVKENEYYLGKWRGRKEKQ